jgi:methanogenic corrinoid protein MtbC1
MTKEVIFDMLSSSVVEADKERVRKAAHEVVNQNIDPVEAIEKGLSRGMNIIGER